jgi:phosphoribosylformylglycinamidine cyclo-ligase
MPVGMALLEPTRLYVKPVLGLMERVEIRGMAHITGGGFYENIPRMFAAETGGARLEPVIREGSWTIPPVFSRIAAGLNDAGSPGGAEAQRRGAELLGSDRALRKTMFNTFNMGIGFVLALARKDAGKAIEYLDGKGFPAWEIGRAAPAGGDASGIRFE